MENNENQNIADTTQQVDTNIQTPEVTQDWFDPFTQTIIPDDADFAPETPEGEEPQGNVSIPDPINTPVPQANDVDAGRFEHWQSIADKTARERDILMSQLQEYNQVKPVLDYIQRDPEMLKLLQDKFQATQTPQFTMPSKPERPANYNLVDLTDPNSATSKYHRDMEEYQTGLTEYIVQKDQAREQAIIDQQQREYQRQQADAQKQQIFTSASQYAKSKGLDDVQVKEFIEWSSDDKNITLDNLLYAFMANKQPQVRQNIIQNKTNSMTRNYAPPPVVGNSSAPVDYNEAMNLGLKELAKKFK